MARKTIAAHRWFSIFLLVFPVFLFLVLQAGLIFASSGGEGAGGHEAATGESSARITDLILRAVNFGIFFVVLFILLRKPLKQGMAGRREGIQKELDELEQKKRAAQQELAQFEARIAGMKEEREALLRDFIRDGEREKQKILDGAQKTAARIVEQAQLTIQQEIQKANQALREEVAEKAVKMAEDLLRKNITDTDQKVLIGEYLAKVVH